MIPLLIDNARRCHRMSVWATRMAKRFGWQPYTDMAVKFRREAYEFLEEARRAKRATT